MRTRAVPLHSGRITVRGEREREREVEKEEGQRQDTSNVGRVCITMSPSGNLLMQIDKSRVAVRESERSPLEPV